MTQNKVMGLLQLTPRDDDLGVNTAMALDYTAYQLTWQIEEATRQSSNRMCQKHPLQSGLVAIQLGVFAMVHGDLYYRLV